jgi:hypothetical protein
MKHTEPTVRKQAGAEKRATEIIQEIRTQRKSTWGSYDHIKVWMSELDDRETSIFNEKLNIYPAKPDHTPALLQWIKEDPSPSQRHFIEFILSTPKIWLDVNAPGPDGKTTFQALHESYHTVFELQKSPWSWLFVDLFKRGYILTESDGQYIKEHTDLRDAESLICFYKVCPDLKDEDLIGLAFQFAREVYVVESIRKKKIIGYGFPATAWVAFANNTIQYHAEYWNYYEAALKYYGLWDIILEDDKKGTFERKLETYRKTAPEQNHNLDRLFKKLSPAFE